jgi:beta-1,4-N-acetylglucosaminyltransferase
MDLWQPATQPLNHKNHENLISHSQYPIGASLILYEVRSCIVLSFLSSCTIMPASNSNDDGNNNHNINNNDIQSLLGDHNNNNNPNKNIFVTVGTTQFDKLVDSVTTSDAFQWMQQQGYTTLTIQYGRGKKPNINNNTIVGGGNSNHQKKRGLTVQCYDFASSLEDDMKRAHLIISHAGAGTVMEALKLQKKLVVVINTDLMNNHQLELATAMHTRRLLWMVSSPEELTVNNDNDRTATSSSMSTWYAFEKFVPLPHQEGDDDGWDFPRLLDSFLGYHDETSNNNNKKRE